uniref:Uncharacterized protein n=1 Tax=Arundo donax TaxID=35708 RepID=A0A0A9DGF9_ARUDO
MLKSKPFFFTTTIIPQLPHVHPVYNILLHSSRYGLGPPHVHCMAIPTNNICR